MKKKKAQAIITHNISEAVNVPGVLKATSQSSICFDADRIRITDRYLYGKREQCLSNSVNSSGICNKTSTIEDIKIQVGDELLKWGI